MHYVSRRRRCIEEALVVDNAFPRPACSLQRPWGRAAPGLRRRDHCLQKLGRPRRSVGGGLVQAAGSDTRGRVAPAPL